MSFTYLFLSYNFEAGVWHGLERSRLRQHGITPPFIDGQIAAIAAVNNLILVTRNIKDFRFFSDLKIENWFN